MCLNILLPQLNQLTSVATEIQKVDWSEEGIFPVTAIGFAELPVYNKWNQELPGWVLATHHCPPAIADAQRYARDSRIALSIRLRADNVQDVLPSDRARSFFCVQLENIHSLMGIALKLRTTRLYGVHSQYGWKLFNDPFDPADALVALDAGSTPDVSTTADANLVTIVLQAECDLTHGRQILTLFRENPAVRNAFGLLAR